MVRLRTKAAILVSCGLIPGSQLCADDVAVAEAAFRKWVETFGIERPWDELADLPESQQRRRGALAHVNDRLNSGAVAGESRAHLFLDLAGLLALDSAEEIRRKPPAFNDYREFFQVDVFRLWKQLISNDRAPVRWGANFKEFYFSRADGAGVPFDVRMPPEIEGRDRYPMVMVLNGGPRVSPGEAFPFIQVRPSRGRIWGYRSISGYDAMETIEFMKRHYPVDPDRVYLVGSSAGGSGAMHLASWNADEFAAVLPLVAAGTGYPLVNFRNLPVAFHHGTDDWTSAICNARVQAQRMQELNCPVILKEYAGVGHSVPRPHEPLMTWLFDQTRNRSPSTLSHECESPSLGRSYWGHIREFEDPHQRASMEASVEFSGETGTVRVWPRNVRRFTLDSNLAAGGKGRIETVEIEEAVLNLMNSGGSSSFLFHDGRWQIESGDEAAKPARRPYEAGAAANLYQGEPLLIVYGTGGNESELLRAAARKLATCGGPHHNFMRDRFPVIADVDLNPDQAANCNLILVGTPDENQAVQAILPELPIAIRDRTLIAAGRKALPLTGQVVSLLHPHPNHPDRLVYLVMPNTDGNGLQRFGEAPQRFLAGSDGFDRISQPDLVVQDLNHRIARQMQFGKDWNWIEKPNSETAIPDRFNERANLARVYMKLMREKSGADFALWWGPADKGMWGYDFNFLSRFNPRFYTQADFRTRHHLAETMIGGVTGAELKEIWERWGRNGELLMNPESGVDGVKDEEHYRVHTPIDLYIKLGQRKKTIRDPKPGPLISSEMIMDEIFR